MLLAALDDEMLGKCEAQGLPCVPAKAGTAKDFRGDLAAFRQMGVIKVSRARIRAEFYSERWHPHEAEMLGLCHQPFCPFLTLSQSKSKSPSHLVTLFCHP